MESENETVAEIAKEMRTITFGEGRCPDCGADFQRSNQWPKFADRIEAARKREVDSLNFKLMTAMSEQKTVANVLIEQTNRTEKLECEVDELRKCLKEAVEYFCGNDKLADCAEKVYGNPKCETEGQYCMVERWRKALEGKKPE